MVQFFEQGFGHQGVPALETARGHPGQGSLYGQGAEFHNGQIIHLDRLGRGIKARAPALRAGHVLAVAGKLVPPGVAVLHALFQQGNHAGPEIRPAPVVAFSAALAPHFHGTAHPVAAQSAFPAVFLGLARLFFAVEQSGQGVFVIIRQRGGQTEAEAAGKSDQLGFVTLIDLGVFPGQQRAGLKGQSPVGGNQGRFKVFHRAQTQAALAGPLGAVEGKQLRRQGRQADLAIRAGRQGAERRLLVLFSVFARNQDNQAALAVFQGQFNGVGQASANAFAQDQPVHHQVDAVFFVLVQDRHVVQGINLAVDPHSGEPLGLELFKAVLVRALLQQHQGGQHHAARPVAQSQNVGDDLVRGPRLNGPAAFGAVHAPQAGEKHP